MKSVYTKLIGVETGLDRQALGWDDVALELVGSGIIKLLQGRWLFCLGGDYSRFSLGHYNTLKHIHTQ